MLFAPFKKRKVFRFFDEQGFGSASD